MADSLALLGHPIRDCLLPLEVVSGLLVAGEVILAPIRLVEEELKRIIGLLEHIET